METSQDDDKAFKPFSDEFLARAVLSDTNASESAKELSFRLLSTKKRLEFTDLPNPSGYEEVSSTGAGPYVYASDKILGHDGKWFTVVDKEVGSAVDRWVRVARDFR